MGQYTVYTAGHGELDWESFARLLRPHDIEIIADVRAYPIIPASEFDRDRVERLARNEGWEYVWLGGKLGALTADGRMDHIAKERESAYRAGIQELLGLAHDRTVCLLGGQIEPEQSHLHMLIAQTLLRQHVEVRHIMPSGSTVPAQADLFHVGLT